MTETVVAPPYVRERSEMRKRVQLLLLDVPRLTGVVPSTIIEHSYDADLIKHEVQLRIEPVDEAAVLVILHPADCGCDSLTDELVWHG